MGQDLAPCTYVRWSRCASGSLPLCGVFASVNAVQLSILYLVFKKWRPLKVKFDACRKGGICKFKFRN